MKCKRCKVEKLDSDFDLGKTRCKECREKYRQYYFDNKDREVARAVLSQNKKGKTAVNDYKRELNRRHPENYILWNVKSRAKKEKIKFDLTHEDIVVPNKCPILNIDLKIGNGCCCANSPSVDRIDPNLGYTKGNIQIISHRANTIKSDATLQELRLLVDYLEREK